MTAPWFICMHALERMAEMDVDRSEVMACLADPEVDYPAPNRGADADRRLAKRGRISVVYHPGDRWVSSVLWSSVERYERERPSGTYVKKGQPCA